MNRHEPPVVLERVRGKRRGHGSRYSSGTPRTRMVYRIGSITIRLRHNPQSGWHFCSVRLGGEFAVWIAHYRKTEPSQACFLPMCIGCNVQCYIRTQKYRFAMRESVHTTMRYLLPRCLGHCSASRSHDPHILPFSYLRINSGTVCHPYTSSGPDLIKILSFTMSAASRY